MTDSILTSVKKLLGIPEEYTQFDLDIIIHINTVFMGLTQLGIGPEEGFSIEDDTATWEDFIEDDLRFEAVKSYVALKTRLLFDPPGGSVHMGCIEKSIAELEWRLHMAAEEKSESE
ncbi:MAG: hypothetical protein J6B01_04745 [Ruminococcus sp.]|nr:hypothetical protein [Ruminococcus sp.]